MTSISTVMKDISLVSEQIFDHTALVRSQINKFLDNFEHNERHKEFDGIIRLVEAADVPLEKLLAKDDLQQLNEQIAKTTYALSELTVPLYRKEHDDYLEAVRKSQCEQRALVESAVDQQRQALKKCENNEDDNLVFPSISSTTEINLD